MTPLKTTTSKALSYQRRAVDKGYTDQYLDVDLSTGTIAIGTIEEKIKKTFIGGKGFDLWLLWHAVSGENKWNDPQMPSASPRAPWGGHPPIPARGKASSHRSLRPPAR